MKEQVPNIRCPYWIRATVYDGWTMALCGSESSDQPPLSDTDIWPRLSDCPWYGGSAGIAAHETPRIYAVKHGTNYHEQIFMTDLQGKLGIEELELKWDDARLLFRQRVEYNKRYD